MPLPRILFVTCMPLDEPRSASMAFMGVLLKEFPDTFAWFSLRHPVRDVPPPFDIPYEHAQPLARPSRFPNLKQYANLILWPRWMGFRAAKFGRRHGAQVVLADLAFEAVVAGRVAARALGLPLLVSVHDDPVERVKVKGFSDWVIRRYEREFARTMQTAVRCGVISDYMGEVYRARFKVETVTLYVGADAAIRRDGRPLEAGKVPIRIGSVGSVNSASNWNLLLEAVRLLNQRLGAGTFRILHIGDFPGNMPVSEDVELTGWVPEQEFARHLARLDVGFVHWDFDPRLAGMGRTSFPLKVHSFIQAQVPMLALGPADSTVVRFVEDHHCGATCSVFDAQKLAAQLQIFVSDENRRGEAAEKLKVLSHQFSREAFFESFRDFVQSGVRGETRESSR